MKMTKDKLVNSPICDSNACYESEFKTQDGIIKTWLCMTSGYTSNTTMTLDSETLKKTLELTADLIKDLRQDHIPPGGGEKLAWFPTVIQLPEVGMIFPEPLPDSGTFEVGQINWTWTVVKSIDIPEDEQHKYPDPTNPGTNYTKRVDMKNPIRFDKLCFMDAAEELGMFKKEIQHLNDLNKNKKQ